MSYFIVHLTRGPLIYRLPDSFFSIPKFSALCIPTSTVKRVFRLSSLSMLILSMHFSIKVSQSYVSRLNFSTSLLAAYFYSSCSPGRKASSFLIVCIACDRTCWTPLILESIMPKPNLGIVKYEVTLCRSSPIKTLPHHPHLYLNIVFHCSKVLFIIMEDTWRRNIRIE